MTNSKIFFRQSVLVLKKSSNPSPELDARVIFEFALGLSPEKFYKFDFDISKTQQEKIHKLIIRRTENEPIAYLTGQKEFFGLDFFVNKNVLIPRPESEWLVEKSLDFLQTTENGKRKTILDIGTGSGCIIISIAKNYPDANFFASDISTKALTVAKKNIQKHNINILLYKSDLFKNITKQKFDLIIANLPYVPLRHSGQVGHLEPESRPGSPMSDVIRLEDDKKMDDISFEPQDAIFTTDNGAAVIKKFLVQSKNYLNKNGSILIELDPRNASIIKSCARKNFPNSTLNLTKDLAGFNRYLSISA